MDKLISQAEAIDIETGYGLAMMADEERRAIRAAALEEAWEQFCPTCGTRIRPNGRCGRVNEPGGAQAFASRDVCPILRALKEDKR